MSIYPPIYFVRHGETAWNAEGRLQGQQDIPLNTTGKKQAQHVGKLVKNLTNFPSTVDYISSPMLRTQTTMQLLRMEAGLDPLDYAIDDRLKEICFGRWEGLTWPEVRASDPKGAAGRETDKWNYVPPDGESYEMLLARIAPWVKALRKPTLVVAHGGVARVLLSLIASEDSLLSPNINIWQGKILMFEEDRFRWIG